MDSDFFSEGYAHKKELDEIRERIESLQSELTGGYDHTTGRSQQEIQDKIASLRKRQDELLLKLKHEEKTQQ